MQAKTFFIASIWLLSTLHSTATIADNDESMPDLALLEFLGSFEAPDGEWLDPMELDNILSQEKANNEKQNIEKDSTENQKDDNND